MASRFLVSCPRRIKKGRQGVSKIEGDVREKQERRPSYTSERSSANHPAQLSFPGFYGGNKVEIRVIYIRIAHVSGPASNESISLSVLSALPESYSPFSRKRSQEKNG